jgi:hypothetical protein
MKKQSVVSIVIALLLGFMLGLLITLSINLTPSTDKDIETKKSFVNELREKGFLPPEPEIITDVYGKTKEIKDNQLIVILEDRFDDPLGEFLPKTMTININEETEIFKVEEKPFNVFEQEQKEFEQKIKEYGDEIPAEFMPPESFVKIEMELADIREGDVLTIFSKLDFKGKSEFAAASIHVEQTEELPTE